MVVVSRDPGRPTWRFEKDFVVGNHHFHHATSKDLRKLVGLLAFSRNVCIIVSPDTELFEKLQDLQSWEGGASRVGFLVKKNSYRSLFPRKV